MKIIRKIYSITALLSLLMIVLYVFYSMGFLKLILFLIISCLVGFIMISALIIFDEEFLNKKR